MPPHDQHNLQTAALLGEASWIRRLAHSLVRDAELADDLAQQTWVQALQSPPQTNRSVRGWLRTVMKNLVRQEHRSTSRRLDREHIRASDAFAQEEEGAELLARVGVQQELTQSIMQLDEPYRTTILLRFFEELTPTAIAAKHGLPVSTVKTRLNRGLGRLRETLEAHHPGSKSSWALALLPVLRAPAGKSASSPTSLLSLGALVVNSKAILVLVAVLLGAGYFVSKQLAGPHDDPLKENTNLLGATPSKPLQTESVSGADGTDVEMAMPERREASAPDAAGTTPSVLPDTDERLVQGRVVDLRGRPIAELEIVATPLNGANTLDATPSATPALGVSGPDGRFVVPSPGSRSMRIRSERYTTVMEGVASTEGTDKETILVVAPAIAIRGQVRDDLGVGIANAIVRLDPSEQMQANIPFILDFSREVDIRVLTDGEGQFALESAPVFLSGQITAAAEGYSTDQQPAPVSDNGHQVFVLARPLHDDRTLSGVVLDMRGQGVEGATVGLGVETTTSDELGRFAFFQDAPNSIQETLLPYFGAIKADRLIAMKAGHHPAELVANEFDESENPIWPDHVVLRLGDEPLSIRGRVVSEDGDGLAGIRVWIGDGTFLGARRIEGRSFPEFLTVESAQAGLDAGWPFVETDEQGNFELSALMDRSYEIVALDPGTLLRVAESGVAAGRSDVRLTISYEETWQQVHGRVIDRRGNPMADATVRVSCDAYKRKVQGQVIGTTHGSGQQVTTDDDGRFVFDIVPKEFAYFRIDHDDAIPSEIGRSAQSLRDHIRGDSEDLILTIERRCHFQVELVSPGAADQFEMHNADGVALPLSEFNASGRRDGTRFPIVDGRTNFLAVGDSATTLVLLLNDVEVGRMPVSLNPGEQPTLRP